MKKLLPFLFALCLFTPSTFAINTPTDLDESNFYYDGIMYLYEQGILEGNPDGTFMADEGISRAAFTKIVIEAVFTDEEINECENPTFEDSKNEWYSKYICKAEMEGIVSGYPDKTYRPGEDVILVEGAKIIVNALDYDYKTYTSAWYKGYIDKLAELQALPLTLTGFEHELTRGEMSEIIYRLLSKINFKRTFNYNQLAEGYKLTEERMAELMIMDEAALYAESIIKLQEETTKTYSSFNDFYDSNIVYRNFDEIELKRIGTVNILEDVKSKLLLIGPLKDDSSLLNALTQDLNNRINILNEDIVSIIELYIELEAFDESVSQQVIDDQFDKIYAAFEDSITKQRDSHSEFAVVYDAFFEKHGFEKSTPDSEAAKEYAQLIFDIFDKATDEFFTYQNFFANSIQENGLSKPSEIEENYLQAIKNIKGFKEDIGALTDYEGDDTFRLTTINSIQTLIDLLENEEREIMELWMNIEGGPQNISTAELEVSQTLHDEMMEKYNIAAHMVENAHLTFSRRYDFYILD